MALGIPDRNQENAMRRFVDESEISLVKTRPKVYARGWRVDWVAVRRQLNQEADRLATAGVLWAARLADDLSMATNVK